MTLNYYERHLLALAVEAGGGSFHSWYADAGGIKSWTVWAGGKSAASVDSFADALTALLRDLGVEVHERPSAEAVQHARLALSTHSRGVLTALDPLLAAAVLEADRG